MMRFFRVFSFALKDMWRNFSLSVMTVVILVLMLLSMNTLIVVRAITNQSVEYVKDQIDVSVYFDPAATDEQIEEIRAYVDSFPEVEQITFVSEKDVLEQFRNLHANDTDILASLDELDENPLGPTMIVKTREPQQYQKVITALAVPEYDHVIEAKTFADTERAIERISVITTQIQHAVFLLSGLFAFIAFFVIFNTIRVAIYTQRREIGIKKLVGATDWFVRGPYLVESLFFSLIAVVVTAVVVYWVIGMLDPYIGVIFGVPGFLTNYFSSNILLVAGGQFAGVLLLTVITSGLAMRRYLRT